MAADTEPQPAGPHGGGGAAETGAPVCPVVGIGASAGGLEALRRFFEAMPADSGLAFVVVQHLDPSRQSHLAELLNKVSPMPVAGVEDGARVEPDHVHVILPNAELTIEAGVLHLAEPSARRGARHPIDMFFSSLAEDRHERAVAIVFSGTGNDGTAGIRAIKPMGGLTIAQDPETADHDSMPRSAIASGLVDQVLAPEAMPEALLRYLRHLDVVDRGEPEALAAEGDIGLDRLLAFLRARSGHEFRFYKKSTLVRRIHRRMSVTGQADLAGYEDLLRGHPEEVDALVKDLMISVTGFLRDPQAWQALEEKVIRPLVGERESGDAIRIWVPGCATGEEAYTVALLLAERADEAQKTFEVKIFATDTADHHLSSARRGRFPATIERDVSAARLSRFFDPVEDSYQIKPELRDWVIFAPQNLLRDPPFFRLDLITCRNLLIYLEGEAQARVVALLHFALREIGHLFLGNAETVGRHDALFETVSKKWRIYRRLGPTRHDIVDFPIAGRDREHPRPVVPSAREPHQTMLRPPAIAQRLLAERFAPASVLIDRGHRVLYFHGDTERYLAQPSGEPTRDLLAMARERLGLRLRGAVQEAIEHNRPVTFGASVRASETRQQVAVTVEPLRGRTAEGLLLVSFEEVAEPAAPERRAGPAAIEDGAREQEFETELQQVRDELNRTIEQLESANEELKASNEEITSMNEELQSSNEELETSKEELQSLNEELNTVNSQLQHKVEELEETTNDLRNLFASTDVATIFLDRQLRIRWFTPATAKLVDFMGSDVGRPLSHFAIKFTDRDLAPDAARVLEKLMPAEAEVEAEDGRWYLRRVLPYRTQDDRIDGVVVTFTDITASKQAERALRYAHRHMQDIYDTVREPLLVLDPNLRVRSANAAFYQTFRVEPGETEGRLVYELGNRQWDIPRLRELLGEILPDNQFFDGFEVEHQLQTLGRRSVLLNARRIDDAQMILLAFEDVTERKHWEERQQMLLGELSHRVKNMLATVQAIAMQTLRGGPSLEAFRDAFLGRLTALGGAHTLLTDSNWQGAQLHAVLDGVLDAYQSEGGDRIRIRGDDLPLTSRAALTLSLAINELATNAAKYGALSVPVGRVDVECRRAESGQAASVLWRESGGPAIEGAVEPGFGLGLIGRSLSYELNGEFRSEFLSEGLRAELLIPDTPGNVQTE